jgi:hypothetical protein
MLRPALNHRLGVPVQEVRAVTNHDPEQLATAQLPWAWVYLAASTERSRIKRTSLGRSCLSDGKSMVLLDIGLTGILGANPAWLARRDGCKEATSGHIESETCNNTPAPCDTMDRQQ